MRITIDLQSPVSFDDQIRNQLRELLALGRLSEGDALPSVRQLSADLGVHFNTVARVYRTLQDEGLLVVGRGRGVFVRAEPSRPRQPAKEVREGIAKRVRDIFVDALLGGLSVEETKEFVLKELEAFARKERR